MKANPLLRLLLSILILAIATPAIGTGCTAGKATKREMVITVDGVEVDLGKLEMAKVMEKTASVEVITASNPLYTPDYSTYTKAGEEITRLHGEIAQAIIAKIEALDANYQDVFKLNDEFNANLEESFAIWQTYSSEGSQKSSEAVAAFYAEEEKLNQDYIDFMVMETLLRAQIDSLSNSLERMREREDVPVNYSLHQSECLLMLLRKYAEMSWVYAGKYIVVFSKALVLHTTEQQSGSGLPADLITKLTPGFDEEQNLIARAIDSYMEVQAIERQIARGIQGMKVFKHEVLKVSINMIEENMPVLSDIASEMQSDPGTQDLAELAGSTMKVYEMMLKALKDIDGELDAEGRPEWLAWESGDNKSLQSPGILSSIFRPDAVFAAGGIEILVRVVEVTDRVTAELGRGRPSYRSSGSEFLEKIPQTGISFDRIGEVTSEAANALADILFPPPVYPTSKLFDTMPGGLPGTVREEGKPIVWQLEIPVYGRADRVAWNMNSALDGLENSVAKTTDGGPNTVEMIKAEMNVLTIYAINGFLAASYRSLDRIFELAAWEAAFAWSEYLHADKVMVIGEWRAWVSDVAWSNYCDLWDAAESLANGAYKDRIAKSRIGNSLLETIKPADFNAFRSIGNSITDATDKSIENTTGVPIITFYPGASRGVSTWSDEDWWRSLFDIGDRYGYTVFHVPLYQFEDVYGISFSALQVSDTPQLPETFSLPKDRTMKQWWAEWENGIVPEIVFTGSVESRTSKIGPTVSMIIPAGANGNHGKDQDGNHRSGCQNPAEVKISIDTTYGTWGDQKYNYDFVTGLLEAIIESNPYSAMMRSHLLEQIRSLQ